MANLPSDQIYDVMRLVKEYQFNEILKTILGDFEKYLNLENVVSILNFAMANRNEEIAEKCYKFLDDNAVKFAINSNFLKLSESALLHLVKRDTFEIDEMKIFTATSKWCEENPMANKEEIKKAIRFSLMETSALVNLTPTTLAPNPNEIVEAIKMKRFQLNVRKRNSKDQLTYQSKKFLLEEYGAKLIKGTSTKMLSNNKWNELMRFDKNNEIVIEFDTIRKVNHIEFNLNCPNGLGYIIEVSLKGKEWKKIIDYSKYTCRFDQSLYFDIEQIKFIKIYHKYFYDTHDKHITDFFVQLTDSVPSLVNDIIVATKDTIKKATIDGEYKLLSEGFDYSNVQSFSGYLSIPVLFNQPYLMSSISFNCSKTSIKDDFVIMGEGNILISKINMPLDGHCIFEFKQCIITSMRFSLKKGKYFYVSNLAIPAKL